MCEMVEGGKCKPVGSFVLGCGENFLFNIYLNSDFSFSEKG